MPNFSIPNEKLNQAAAILQREGIDCWLSLAAETRMNPDPALDLILDLEMTWLSAFLVTAKDERIAIIGRFDAQPVKEMGGYSEVIAYDEDLFPELLKLLERLNPKTIALNYSENDGASDGLTHGQWLLLTRALAGTPYAERLVSAEGIIRSLRGQKTPSEVERLRQAVRTTEAIIRQIGPRIKAGMSELELYGMVQGLMQAHGVEASWDPCPNVSAGPNTAVGHALPDGDVCLQPGQVVHMDLGVAKDGYVSDMQRVWYLPRPGEKGLPEPVQKAFDAVRGAVVAAAEVLRPGVEGWKVDQASREYIVKAGYPEYRHAVGHHLGRSVHDGAGLLGPLWPRYGKTSSYKVEENNVFTLELGVLVPEYGFVGLEEDVLVKKNGLEWISDPQTEVIIVEG
ncbi:MAG: Xaa-Pro peptidase family protein [Anaerolineaceae bacterium]|nr:Xaa-Pro peptidase family protein [Anaerolineaceae bacterium]